MSIQREVQPIRRKVNRKSKMEILETIKNFIESEDQVVFNKSSMLDSPWNLDPRTVDEFLQIAYFCQNNFPRIRIVEKNGRKLFQHLDYQAMKQEMKELTLEKVNNVETVNLLIPKVYPVFKCKECEFELGYPAHHNEPMNHYKNSDKLWCALRECNFTQQIPKCYHCNKKMEIFVKYNYQND